MYPAANRNSSLNRLLQRAATALEPPANVSPQPTSYDPLNTILNRSFDFFFRSPYALFPTSSFPIVSFQVLRTTRPLDDSRSDPPQTSLSLNLGSSPILRTVRVSTRSWRSPSAPYFFRLLFVITFSNRSFCFSDSYPNCRVSPIEQNHYIDNRIVEVQIYGLIFAWRS